MVLKGIGFIGFGEAASAIASGLREENKDLKIYAYDLMTNDEKRGLTIRENAEKFGVGLATTPKELMEKANVIFSATSAKFALGIAEGLRDQIPQEILYCDMNSAAPGVKKSIAAALKGTQAIFVDVGVMEVVPPYRHKVPLAVSGEGAESFKDLLMPLGMNIQVLDNQPGSASSLKMLRSIFMKGFTSLLLETLYAAHVANVSDEIMQSIEQTLKRGSVEQIATQLLTRSSINAERRIAEMSDVLKTLHELNTFDHVTHSTIDTLQEFVNLDLKAEFDFKVPENLTVLFNKINEKRNRGV